MNYDKMSRVSMNGRMAYVIMCVEAFLKTKYDDRDWSLIAEKMWLATEDNWTDWPLMFASFIPDVLVDYDEYDESELNGMTAGEFSKVKSLYNGITKGNEDDPDDEVNYMLNKPFEMAQVYCNTVIGDGAESLEIIRDTEIVLYNNGIDFPDYTKVMFTPISEFNGWGNRFNGRDLSIILK